MVIGSVPSRDGIGRYTVVTKIELVNRSGAVSPAARATATIVAVTIPPDAVGRIIVS